MIEVHIFIWNLISLDMCIPCKTISIIKLGKVSVIFKVPVCQAVTLPIPCPRQSLVCFLSL